MNHVLAILVAPLALHAAEWPLSWEDPNPPGAGVTNYVVAAARSGPVGVSPYDGTWSDVWDVGKVTKTVVETDYSPAWFGVWTQNHCCLSQEPALLAGSDTPPDLVNTLQIAQVLDDWAVVEFGFTNAPLIGDMDWSTNGTDWHDFMNYWMRSNAFMPAHISFRVTKTNFPAAMFRLLPDGVGTGGGAND